MLVVDQSQFDRFFSILEKPEKDEVYFVSLSARNKYLTDEERQRFRLGKTEMFGRTTIKDFNDLPYIVRKLEGFLGAYRTRSGLEIPEQARVVYINVNPSSTIKAYTALTKDLNDALFRCHLGTCDYSMFKSIERRILNHVQRSRSRQVFVDIDFDNVSETLVKVFRGRIRDTENYLIRTKSGVHVLIKKETLTKDIKLGVIIENFNDEAKTSGGEVEINQNQMVPMPGTMQAGHLVTIE